MVYLRDKIRLNMNSKILLLFAVQLTAICAYTAEDFGKLNALWDASTLCSYIQKILPSNVSESCAAHLTESCNHPEVIASILDASSRFPYTGIQTATRLDLGNFDECVAVDHKYSGGRILGKHCFVGLVILDLANPTDVASGYRLSTCIPSGCSAADYNLIYQAFFQETLRIPYPGVFTDTYCRTKEDKIDWAAEDYVTTILILICIGLMIVCTIYDLYLKRNNKKTIHPLLLAFSVYTNGRKLLQTSKSISHSEQILVFHGLKVISMLWIISGHGIKVMTATPMLNQDYYNEYQTLFYPLYLSTAVYAVDTFFFISGFLMAYQYLKMKKKPLASHILGVPVNILHRYMRLTPAAFMLFMVTISLYARIGTGPMYGFLTDYIQKNCRKYWWAYFLYIQNYNNYKDEDMCLIPTWYLSADMQLFLITPFVLIPLSIVLRDTKKLKTCMWCLAALNVVAVIIPIVIKLCYKDYVNNYETHPRLVVYFLGIMMGAFMRETKDRPFISAKLGVKRLSIINLIVWVIVLSALLTLILWNKYVELHGSYEYEAIFSCCAKGVWALSLCWIVYSSYYGYGGFVNWILTRPIMQILGKLTYSIYLVHSLVVFHYYMVTRTKYYFSDYTAFHLWCGYFIISIILAFFWTLAFESPLIIVEKMVFGGLGRQPRPPPKREIQPTNINITVINNKDFNDNDASSSGIKSN